MLSYYFALERVKIFVADCTSRFHAVWLSKAGGSNTVCHWSHPSRSFQPQNSFSDWQLYNWYGVTLPPSSQIPQHTQNNTMIVFFFFFSCFLNKTGKERLFLEVARCLRKKVYVGVPKLRLLECLELPQEDMQWFTSNEQESQIHVVPMWTIASFKRMKHIVDRYSVWLLSRCK